MIKTPINRRQFLKVAGATAATGFALGVVSSTAGCSRKPAANSTETNWLAWFEMSARGKVVLHCPRVELGQGIHTGLAMVFAEELDLDMSNIEVAPARLDSAFGSQLTQDSDGIRSNWALVRQLAALARQQLRTAAAAHWQVDVSQCATDRGSVVHAPTQRQLNYEALLAPAARLPLPDSVPLKTPDQFTLVGKPYPRLDIPPKVNGAQRYNGDIQVPGMLYAAIVHCPWVGGKVASVNEQSVEAAPGLKQLVALENAVALVADTYWAAEKARRALEVTWARPDTPVLDSEQQYQYLDEQCSAPGPVAFERQQSSGLSANAGERPFSARFRFPYQAHAPMETMNCIADVRAHRCEVWAPTQAPWYVYRLALNHGLSSLFRFMERVHLKLTRETSDRIKVHVPMAGGGFGRRLYLDYVQQAIEVSKAVKAPVKLMWSREDEIRNGFYQPASAHRIEAALNTEGRLTRWYHRIAGPGDHTHGADFFYDCDDAQVEVSSHTMGMRIGAWRSVSDATNTQARELFINRMCEQNSLDPFAFRLSMLSGSPRLGAVLEKARALVEPAEGVRVGVAVHQMRASYIAQVVEVSHHSSVPEILRVICVIDCGIAVNPDSIRAQMEGGIVFGLSALLHDGITIKDGRIEQSNFHDYPLLRYRAMPTVQTHIMPSAEAPGGVGELAVPCIAPALIHALGEGVLPRDILA